MCTHTAQTCHQTTTTPNSANLFMCLGCMTCVAERYRNQSSTQLRAMKTKNCRNCGVSIILKPNALNRKYCSPECKQTSNNQTRTQERRSVRNHTCQTCGKIMTHLKGRKKHCSISCKDKHKADLFFARRLLKTYEISLPQYEMKLNSQNNRCAICRQPETAKQNGVTRRLAVDHCHETNQTRGLLCVKCNLAIGQFKENWLVLENAIEYLAYHHCKHGSSKVQAIQEPPILN